MVSFFILVPFLCVLLLNLPWGNLARRLALWVGLGLTAGQAAVSACALAGWIDLRAIPVSPFFKYDLALDTLSIVLLLCSALVFGVALLLSRPLVSQGEQRFNFVCLLLLMLAGTNAVALVRDVFSLYVFIEAVSIVSFILISFNKDQDAFEGAFKYIVLSSMATVLMVLSISLLVLVAGTTSFDGVRAAVAASRHAGVVLGAIGLFLCGLFIKGGLMPFHGWLPDAYTCALNPVSVCLAGIGTKAVGVYTLIRLAYFVFGIDAAVSQAFLLVGAFSIVAGSLAALNQTDYKRLLAYSSISQVGYIILGLGAGTGLGLAAAAFHFFNHAVFKTLLFVNAGALEQKTGLRDMRKLGGLSARMPLTGFSSLIGALSAAGVPPLSGFWSKLLIIIALIGAGYHGYALVAVLASVLTLAYMLAWQRNIFFGPLAAGLENIEEAGWEISGSALLLAVILIGVGIAFPLYLCKLIW